MPLSPFHPIVQRWFAAEIGTPTAAQARGWASIAGGRHTLIAAPTGSGKTLAAFLTALDDLLREGLDGPLPDEVRVVYVSPLKALSADIHKNLAEPRRGIGELAARAGLRSPHITAAVRTGDTTQAERAAMLRTPPHILVTTPESLYLLLTAERSRHMLRTVRTVIVDEIHAVIGTRRGAHLALSLERLRRVAARPLLRLGLSATQKPIEDVARFLVGTQEAGRRDACTIVDEGHRREMELGVEIPASPLDTVMSREVWLEYYDRLAALIRAHRTTLVFVNTRRMAERTARHLSDRLGEEAVTAHHGSLSKEKRLDAETRLKSGQLKALVATASLELGIDIGHVDLVCQIGSPHRIATLIQRVGRSGHSISGVPRGRIFPVSRDDLVECAALLRAVRRGELDAIVNHDTPLDVLSQQIVAECACQEYTDDDLYTLVRGAWPYRDLERADFDAVLAMTADGFATRRGRRAALVHRDEVNRRVRTRRGARLLAQTSGGAIPEVADYRVVLEPEDTFIGTLNEDFAIESTAGDVFQLGNSAWRVLQVAGGTVRVADAAGVPPNIPFWLGEAPARSDELSRAVSDLRADVESMLRGATADDAVARLARDTGLTNDAAEQAVAYFADGLRALGAIPTQQTLVLERFFDEAGGMQLVLHAPFGSRINKAWGLALRKRFCRQFNFELQAAATDDALLLSLGPQHSFPLADVFRYLHPDTTRDVLVQAFLDAPVFPTRWRWNTTIALAVPRSRGRRKVAPQIQRMLADDLMAAVFPDAAACLENIPGDRQIPDHPLVKQTVRDCLQEAMDFDGLRAVLERIHRGELQLVARDTPEPSVFAHDILNAKPYAFLDDAPLEERRAHAVLARRATDPSHAGDLGALDAAAIERVRQEIQPDPRDADELHDWLMTAGFLDESDVASLDDRPLRTLADARRTARVTPAGGASLLVAAERLPEIRAIHPSANVDADIEPPPSRAARKWTREEAMAEILRGRMALTGPATAGSLARSLHVAERDVDAALLTLESQGIILRGLFTPGAASRQTEWCDRSLLARIHRYTLNRLRAEIEPVSPADFMRFLFRWQHVEPSSRLKGIDGLREALAVLDGFELPAGTWERAVLPARVADYEPSMLDMLCLAGETAWGRLSSVAAESARSLQLGSATPVALFLREHDDAWRALHAADESLEEALHPNARALLDLLRARGASFLTDLASVCGLDRYALHHAMGTLVACGLARSDGFSGLRQLLSTTQGRFLQHDARARFAGRWTATRRVDATEFTEDGRLRPSERVNASVASGFSLKNSPETFRVTSLRQSHGGPPERSARRRTAEATRSKGDWSTGLSNGSADGTSSSEHVWLPPSGRGNDESPLETHASMLLRRYGVVFRRIVTRETALVPWRDLVRVYRRLEARGEIRGGRFVSGMSGEQFALPEAVERLREVRRVSHDEPLITISTADPLNLTGIVAGTERIRAAGRNRLVYRQGTPIAVMEGDFVRELVPLNREAAADVAHALGRRRLPSLLGT